MKNKFNWLIGGICFLLIYIIFNQLAMRSLLHPYLLYPYAYTNIHLWLLIRLIPSNIIQYFGDNFILYFTGLLYFIVGSLLGLIVDIIKSKSAS